MHHALFALTTAALFVSAQVHADATVVYVKGDVRNDGVPVTQGQRIVPGTTVTTGPGGQAYLRFADQQQIVLDRDTAFAIADFHYVANEPRADRATFGLLRGAARFISGAIGERSPDVVALRIPQATLRLRDTDTDFMVALVNPAYLKVLKGAVGVTNSGGTVVFGANTAGTVAFAAAMAEPVFVSALPAAASGHFASLAAAPIGTTETRTAASGTAGAATGTAPARTTGVSTVVVIGIGVAALAGAAKGSGTTTHH